MLINRIFIAKYRRIDYRTMLRHSQIDELTNLGNTTYDNRNIFTYEVTLICTWKTEVLYVMHILISFFYICIHIYTTYTYVRA